MSPITSLSSSSAQVRPTGPITIHLSKPPQHIYTNGDRVTGIVHCTNQMTIQRVRIRFIGRTSCRTSRSLNPLNSHETTTELFRYERVLECSDAPRGVCADGRVEYAFDFQFPECEGMEEPQAHPKHDDSTDSYTYEYEKGQRLPPSLFCNQGTQVAYILEAQFCSAQPSFTMSPMTIEHIRFSPSLPESEVPVCVPFVPIFPIRIERRIQSGAIGLIEGSSRILRRFSEKLERNGTQKGPLLISLLVISTPEYYRVGAESVLKFSLQAPHEEDETTQYAPVYLRSIRAQAIAHMAVPSASTSRHSSASIEKFELFERRYSVPGLNIGANLAVGGLRVCSAVPPSFETENLTLTYDIRYDLSLECGGKELHQEVWARNVKIEPMIRPADGSWLPEYSPQALS